MTARNLLAAITILSLAGTASAGSVIATGAVRVAGGVQQGCIVANTSSTKTLEYDLTAYDFDGSILVGPALSILAPLTSVRHLIPGTPTPVLFHCQMRVVGGSKKSARLSAMVEAAGGGDLARSEGR